ncbi:MAG: ABC transporter ATP-binding protein [Candidatus Hydrogenedentes bacterium]|nr:ABC transporter ATP-binding protein [Candidatus Hydrogenedentota bacterium]
MAGALLEVDTIVAGYGPVDAVRGLSLTVNEGEVVTLIGANGAGKTSTVNAISGVLRLRSGAIRFAGERIDTLQAHAIVERGVAQVPEGRRIFPRLSVLENLQLGAYLRKDREIQKDLDWIMELFPILRERRPQLGGTLSGGEQQMLAIGRALMCRPKLLLMDEPSMGIAPLLAAKIYESIRQLSERGLTVLLIEQNAHLALRLANRGYVVETGSVVLEGPAATLLGDPRVRKAYLGED